MSADAAMHDDLPPPGGNTAAIAAVAVGILVLLFASLAILFAVYRWQVPSDTPPAPRTLPSPRVIEDETLELQRLRAAQRHELQSYRWVDRDNDIVAIPIERAMEIVAARGADGYAPTVPTQGAPASANPRAPAQEVRP